MTQHTESSSPRPHDPGAAVPPDSSEAPATPAAAPASAAPTPADPASSDTPQVVLRGPGDLAEALPYLLGFHPDDSIVMIGLNGARGRFGSRLRAAIPADPAGWSGAARQLADNVVNGAGPHRRPDSVALFVCQDPREGEDAVRTMERLRPLAQHLRMACGALDVPVVEALCISAGRWWSYTCPSASCCSPEGTPFAREGTSVMAAAAAYAGIRVRGSLREMEARLAPLAAPRAAAQQRALDEACAELLPRMLHTGDTGSVKEETLALSGAALGRFRDAPPRTDGPEADARDDALLGDEEAAAIILGLQDRETRDCAAEWMEGDEAAPAIRLWRALSRRCVGTYADHAAAPLALAGWVSWANGDEPSARVAFGRALEADPDYAFAKLLHQACNHGLNPEPLRSCLRQERGERRTRVVVRSSSPGAGTSPKGRPDRGTGPAAAGARPGDPGSSRRTRIRRRAQTGGDDPPC